jgi:hypothetical protein
VDVGHSNVAEARASAKGGNDLERYVIRIFRRDPTHPDKIAGTVECGGLPERKGFLSSEALVNILVSTKAMQEKRAENRRKNGTGEEFKSFSQIVESIRVELEGPDF